MPASRGQGLYLVLTFSLCCYGCAVMRPGGHADISSDASEFELPSATDRYDPDDAFSRFSPSNITHSVRNVVRVQPDEEKARQIYEVAHAEYQQAVATSGEDRQKKLRAVAKKFERAAKLAPDSGLEEDAMFMVGECLFFTDRYSKATDQYEQLVKKHPNTRYLDQVSQRQFALADYWLTLDQQDPEWAVTPNFTDRRRPLFDTFGSAIRIFDRIRFDDPTGKLSDDATMAAGKAAFLKRRFRRSETFFEDLRESFPESPHQFDAHLLSLKCKMMLYEGPDYDGGYLKEGEELVKRMFRLFPSQAEEHREYLEAALKDIRLKQAEQEWKVAVYYDRRKEYGAARYYYEIVQREFGDTSLAAEANTRLAEIHGRPDVPPQRLAWLANLFPTPEKEKPVIARGAGTVTR